MGREIRLGYCAGILDLDTPLGSHTLILSLPWLLCLATGSGLKTASFASFVYFNSLFSRYRLLVVSHRGT
uniref:Uncharacterized protein n=1 Tax=Picea glauca TaxID=3330 RepID=A0A101LUE6_PICGL|nr:hypothetical protein ABT39_MTgene2638 [Picea glauca]